jgi:hypothetical protein
MTTTATQQVGSTGDFFKNPPANSEGGWVPPALFELFKILHSIRTFTSGMIRFIFSTPHHRHRIASHPMAPCACAFVRPARRCVRLPGLRSLEGDKDSVTAVGFKRVGQAGKVCRGICSGWASLKPFSPEQTDAGQESFGSRGFKTMAGLEQNTIVAEC